MRWLLLLAVTLPFIELAVVVRVGQLIGFWPTMAMLILSGVVGARLARSQGIRVVRDWQQALTEGRPPEEGVIGGALVLLGGVLLVLPGVVSDVLGLVLLIPVSRRMLSAVVARWFKQRLADGRISVVTPAPAFARPTGTIIDVPSLPD